MCGDNGSGKTTLIRLISGLEKQYLGEILLDKTPLSEINLVKWRRNLGIALQEAVCFSGTVRDNICIGNENENKKEINSIINQLGINEIVDRTLNYDCSSLSGGELQKISIARALLRKPKILILDEPNNNLDEESKNWLENFIREYKGTLIYIAHDLKFISLADNVIQL